MKSEAGGFLNGLVELSLRFRVIVLVLALGLMGYGFYSLLNAKYDVFPEFADPQITIQTQAVGLSPEQVETLVTLPIESSMNGAAGLETLRSNSIQGLSVITAIFHSDTDIYRARQIITERLASIASKLPQGVQAPVMVPLTSATGDLVKIGLISHKHSLMELRTLADWTLKPRFLAVPGVAKVSIFGGEVKQLQIQIDPDRLRQYQLSVDDVFAAARRATGVRGAGFVDTGNQRIVLQADGQTLTPEALGESILVVGANSGVTFVATLADVAKIVAAPDLPISAATVMGEPGVTLNIWGQYGANTLEVTRLIEQAVVELKPMLDQEGVELYPVLFRAASFIEIATSNLKTSLWMGGLLVGVILFLFLWDVRTASISVTAIPLSLVAAVIVMQKLGFSLNTMTLGGLAIAIGEVVDDAVIDVENILRRIRENAHAARPKPAFQVVLEASLEVRSAVVYATFAVILVFIPVLTMSGLAGKFFAPLGIAYILAILSSLGVAVTLTPALCLIFFKKADLENEEPRFLQGLKRQYRQWLQQVEKYPRIVMMALFLVSFAGLAAGPFLKTEFLPELQEEHFLIHMAAVPGTSIEESLRIGNRVTQELLKLPWMRFVAQQVGRAEADDTFGPHASEFQVDLRPLSKKEAERALPAIRQVLSKFVGVRFAVNTFLAERIEETLSGYTAPVAIHLYGDSLDLLDQKITEVARVLEKVSGVTDLQAQSPPGAPELSVRLRPLDLQKWGFAAVDVLDSIKTAYQGNVVGQIYEGSRVFDVSVILEPQLRKSIPDVGGLLLKSPAGLYVRLNQLADIQETAGRYGILHEHARRVQTLTCNVHGRDVDSFVREARRSLEKGVTLPAGMYLEFAGTAEAQDRSRHDLMVHSLAAGMGILLLLGIVLNHPRNVMLVLLNLPFALTGGVWALLATRTALSLGALVGFVTLFGITLRNSIMMISHYTHLIQEEQKLWNVETAIQGACERLGPILMTALVAGIGLLPLALGSGTAGREIEGPMAIVILGGLVTSTLLNLLALPALALRYGSFQREESV